MTIPVLLLRRHSGSGCQIEAARPFSSSLQCRELDSDPISSLFEPARDRSLDLLLISSHGSKAPIFSDYSNKVTPVAPPRVNNCCSRPHQEPNRNLIYRTEPRTYSLSDGSHCSPPVSVTHTGFSSI
ncbi:hypothetical protein AAC387_Pa05g1090 [Persea americana]